MGVPAKTPSECAILEKAAIGTLAYARGSLLNRGMIRRWCPSDCAIAACKKYCEIGRETYGEKNQWEKNRISQLKEENKRRNSKQYQNS